MSKASFLLSGLGWPKRSRLARLNTSLAGKIKVSRDGKRVYFTNSLYGAIDPQFYEGGFDGWMVKLDAGPEGGIAFDELWADAVTYASTNLKGESTNVPNTSKNNAFTAGCGGISKVLAAIQLPEHLKAETKLTRINFY